jgi:enoyl-CoA hydratase/carnithine racemase
MALVEFHVEGHVAVASLNSGENRFNPAFLDALLGTLDAIEAQTEATVLLIHSSHEKIFSNGIDLEWLVPIIQKNDLATVKVFFYRLNELFKRLLTYPLVAVAAISGHAFAGGAVFGCAFDFRFMRSDRGYFCLPEVDLGLPFLPGMNAILSRVIPPAMLIEMQLTGVRLTADMCLAQHIVKGAYHHHQLMDEAMAFARQVDKQRSVIAELKARLNGSVIRAIDVEDAAYIESGQFIPKVATAGQKAH